MPTKIKTLLHMILEVLLWINLSIKDKNTVAITMSG